MYIPLLLTTTYTLIAVERESVGRTVQCREEMYFWRALLSTGTRKVYVSTMSFTHLFIQTTYIPYCDRHEKLIKRFQSTWSVRVI